MAESTLLDELLARRDKERAERARGMLLVREEDAHLELNAHGRVRWYMHPSLPGRSINTTIVYRTEIPAHSATGRQRVQGNVVALVLSGHGRSVINDRTWNWTAGDVIALPPLENGVEYQHFNDSGEVAHLLTVEPNWLGPFDVDMGSGFEQVEPHPEEGY